MEPRVGEKRRNLAGSVERIEAAAAHGASLLVLPELVNTGYVFADRAEAHALAEAFDDSETLRAWCDAARRLGIHLVAGIAERDGERLYNSAVFVGPAGLIGRYRKLHLWNDEKRFFAPGDLGLPVFDTAFGRLAIAICYDGWFPEVYRLASAQGADLVCVPTNWVPMPGQRADEPAIATTLAKAAAHSNGLMIACADRVGSERGQVFLGQSVIIGGNGVPLAGPASHDREAILYAPIDVDGIRAARALGPRNHVLHDRRTDLYDLFSGIGTPPRGAG